MGGGLFEGGVVVLAWVLDVHHDALVGDNRTTGLRSHRDGEEAAGLTAVFALQPDRVEAVVAVQGVAVGGDPQVAVGIEGQVIRAGDRGNLGLIEAAEVGLGLLRVATDQQQVPGELLPRVLVVELHDQAVLVFPDRGVLRRVLLVLLGVLAGGTAVLVIRQCDVDQASVRVGFEVLRAVHLGRTHLVRSHAGVDGDLLRGEALDVGLRAVRGDGQQLLPLAGAVELTVLWQLAVAGDLLVWGVALQGGDVEGALVENGHVVLHVPLLDLLGGDELVDVFEAGVVAGVADDGAVIGDVDVAGLVLEAAHGGVLDRGGVRVGGVDLHHPAEAVELVGFLGEVEAVVEALPLALGRALRGIKALDVFLGLALDLGLVGVGPVLLEVLFAGEEGAPRGDAAGAVVQGAADLLAARVGLGLDQLVAGGNASHLEDGFAGDAAVQRAEFALELAGLADLGDFEDGVAVVGQADVDLLIGGVVRVVAREHVWLGGVLVGADVQQAVRVLRVLQ